MWTQCGRSSSTRLLWNNISGLNVWIITVVHHQSSAVVSRIGTTWTHSSWQQISPWQRHCSNPIPADVRDLTSDIWNAAITAIPLLRQLSDAPALLCLNFHPADYLSVFLSRVQKFQKFVSPLSNLEPHQHATRCHCCTTAPLTGRLCKPWEWAESNYKIHYYICRGNSPNACTIWRRIRDYNNNNNKSIYIAP